VNAFGYDTRDEVIVEITIYSNNITECSNQSLASDIKLALDSRFKNEVDKEFVVRIIFQAMDISR
jgi:hypothetical protein